LPREDAMDLTGSRLFRPSSIQIRAERSRCFLLDIKGLLSKTRPDTAGRIYTKEERETRIAVDLWITVAGPWINPWTASCPQAYPQPCWKPVTHKLHSFGGGLPDLMQQWSLPDLMQQKVCIYFGK